MRSEAQEAASAFGAKMQAKLTKLETPVADRREEDERQVYLLVYLLGRGAIPTWE